MDRLARDEEEIDIRHLIDAPEAFSILERWFVEEWEPYYGASGPGDARADLEAANNKNSLPICLIATDSGGDAIGTIALKAASVASDRRRTPWVTAFLVERNHRSRGVGTALLAALETEARRLGFKRLYVATETARELLKRRGWQSLGEQVPTLRGAAEIYALDLESART